MLVAKVPARPTVKSFAETLLYQLGDPLWSRGNTVAKSIRLRELLKRCRVRLLALDEFQHFVDVRQANIPNDVADWLKEQVEEARLAIVVLGPQRCFRGSRPRGGRGAERMAETPAGSAAAHAPAGVRPSGRSQLPRDLRKFLSTLVPCAAA